MLPIELTDAERRALRALTRLEKIWPDSLLIFANGNALSVRKCELGAFPSPHYEVATFMIRNEGGDGGDES